MTRIEFLYFEGCPGQKPAFELLSQVVAQETPDAEIERIEVPGPDEAESFRFIGSPTIRVDGIDLEGPEAEKALGYGWRCRTYSESQPGQLSSVPGEDLIRRRLRGGAAKN